MLRARLWLELLAEDANSPASSSLFKRLLSSWDTVGTLTGTPSDRGRWAAPIPQRTSFPFNPFLHAALVACNSKHFFREISFSRAKGLGILRGRAKTGTFSCDTSGFKKKSGCASASSAIFRHRVKPYMIKLIG